jgi:NADP-dependent 3-hydroxy acid dehydrogenase YdfG
MASALRRLSGPNSMLKRNLAMQVTYDFSGKSVLLIGGTTGIGRATANAFAKAGANLFVAGLGAAQGASLKDEIKAIEKGTSNSTKSTSATPKL